MRACTVMGNDHSTLSARNGCCGRDPCRLLLPLPLLLLLLLPLVLAGWPCWCESEGITAAVNSNRSTHWCNSATGKETGRRTRSQEQYIGE